MAKLERTLAAIAATYELPPGRYPHLDALDIYHEILRNAIERWDFDLSLIDGLITPPSGQTLGNTDTLTHERITAQLGVRPRYAETISVGGGTYTAMLDRAMRAVCDGRASAVLCIVGGKFVKPSEMGFELLASTISEPNLEAPYGPIIPAMYGMIAQQFLHDRSLDSRDCARVAVSARRWALRNPRARAHDMGEISVEDVLASRPIASPFNYLDCSLPCDGGGAFLVTSDSLARELARQPAYVTGYGEFHSAGSMSSTENLLDSGAVVSGREAFEMAGLTPADIDCACLYDAFSATLLMQLEYLGFCGPGTSGEFVHSGAIDPGGSLPVNPNGGLLSFGHTGDASGMSVLLEGARQVMGEAEETQLDAVNHALVHCYGGMMYDHFTVILGRER